ncbi:hypothetical protein [Pseudoalteromonas sp.]|uniref:hypothetical protein n=1 Tax=Pseudoalteromonas sp. TaxID=53249 RepID=UPI003565E11A
MQQGEPICVIDKIPTTQRSKQFIFSQPNNLFLSRRISQHADLPLKQMNEPIYLEDLLKPNLKGV